MIQMNKLLHTVVKLGASDLHLTIGRPPVLRVRGQLRPLSTAVLSEEDTAALMKSITPERAQQEIQETGSTDFAFAFDEGSTRFRVAAFKQRGAIGLVLRQIPNKILSFDQLGLDPRIQQLLQSPRGLILITGPTGAGKTTTLATMIDYININREAHIITIEDPIEYYHPHKRSLVTQREVGTDVPSFAEALRRALRQDPDVILVGEMRDLETMQAALTAAETGHLVLATLHTNSAQVLLRRRISSSANAPRRRMRKSPFASKCTTVDASPSFAGPASMMRSTLSPSMRAASSAVSAGGSPERFALVPTKEVFRYRIRMRGTSCIGQRNPSVFGASPATTVTDAGKARRAKRNAFSGTATARDSAIFAISSHDRM